MLGLDSDDPQLMQQALIAKLRGQPLAPPPMLAAPQQPDMQQQQPAPPQDAGGRQRAVGLLALLSGNKQLGEVGQGLVGDVQHQQQIAAQGQRYSLDRAIKEANEKRQETRDVAEDTFRNKQLGVQDAQRRDIAGERLQAAQAARDLSLQTRNDQFNEREVQALGKQDQKGTAALAAQNAAKNLLDRMQTQPDVPGVGRVESRVPTMLQPDSWQLNQADATELAKSVLLMKGGQISPESLRQQQKALGLAPGSDVNTFKNGIKTALTEVADKLAQREGGFKPENVAEYRKRGGLTSQDVRALIGGGGAGQAGTAALRAKYGL